MLNDKFVKINSYGLDEVIEENEESTISEAVIQPLDVVPSTSAQRIDAPEGIDGYNPVNVSAVTSSIDSNIRAENIKEGVNILGVSGTYVGGQNKIERTIENGVLTNSSSYVIDLSSVTTVGAYALYYAYYRTNLPENTVADFSTIVGLNGGGAENAMARCFYSSYGIKGINLSSLVTVTGNNACQHLCSNCSTLKWVDLSALTTISGDNAFNNAFYFDTALTDVDISNLITITGMNACRYMFRNDTALENIELNSLTTINAEGACYGTFEKCINIGKNGLNLSSLRTIKGSIACCYMYRGCTGIIGVYANSLYEINGDGACYCMFEDDTGIESVSLRSLTKIVGNSACEKMFGGNSSLSSADLMALEEINGENACCQMFYGTALQSIEFTMLNRIFGTTPLYQMLGNCPNLNFVSFDSVMPLTFLSLPDILNNIFDENTGSEAQGGCTVHFPSNFDPSDPNHDFDLSTLTGYPTFGGSASYIHLVFDLPPRQDPE